LVSELDSSVSDRLKDHEIPTLLAFMIPSQSLSEFTQLAKEVESPFPFSYVNYHDSDQKFA
jgi:homogentisate 1,2-dioxygenase